VIAADPTDELLLKKKINCYRNDLPVKKDWNLPIVDGSTV
jgi:hypothetical protein